MLWSARCLLLYRTGIDMAKIAKAVKQKVEKNAKKYSVAQYKGQF